jgi:hypothetical protein
VTSPLRFGIVRGARSLPLLYGFQLSQGGIESGHPAATTAALAVFFATFLSFDAESERWSSSILMMFSLWLS